MKFRWHHLSEHSLWNILFYYFLSSLYMRPVCGYFTGLDKLPSVPSANSAAYGHPGQTQKHGTSQSTCWHLPSTFQNCLTFPSFTVDNTIDFMCSMVIVIEITMFIPRRSVFEFINFISFSLTSYINKQKRRGRRGRARELEAAATEEPESLPPQGASTLGVLTARATGRLRGT